MPSEEFTEDADWEVPQGVDEIDVVLEGEAGESSNGSGGRVEGVLPVTPQETLRIRVGYGGGSGRAGDGGGAADIRQDGDTLDDRVVVAGGGGGESARGDGGSGGGSTGGSGGSTYGGGGGSQSSGGSGGGDNGQNGGFGFGGSTPRFLGDRFQGGGGGSGWYGGGGGGSGSLNQAGGGGGGSNYVGGLDTVIANERGTSTASYGNATVQIEYEILPTEPQSLTASDGFGAVDLEWDLPENDDAAETEGYRVYRSTTSEVDTSDTQIADLSATSYTDTDVDDGQTYYYVVTAYNTSGESGVSTEVSISTAFIDIPTNLTAITENKSTIELSWDEPDADPSVNEYTLQRSSEGEFNTIATVSTTSYTDTDLTNGQTYEYRVSATNDYKTSDYSDNDSATTDLPEPSITNIAPSDHRELEIEYEIQDNSPHGELLIYRSDDESIGSLIHTESDFSTESYTDTDLLDGFRYYYTIERDTGDASAQTDLKDSVTTLPAPTNLSVSSVTATTVVFTWTDNHNNGDVRIEYRRSDSSDWDVWSTIDREVESEELTELLNGQQYEVRVFAVTDNVEEVDI